MKKLFFYIVAALLVFSCNSRPKGVLSEQKMSKVLYEIYLSDAVHGVRGYTPNLDSAKRQSYRYILHKYNISVADFDSSMTWYAIRPEKQQRVYDKVIQQMQDLQKEVNAGKYKQIVPPLTANDTLDIWQMPRRFDMTANNRMRNRIWLHFDKNLFQKGNALLMTYKIKIDKEDKSVDNKLMLKINYNNKIDSIVTHYKKDGIWRKYRVYVPISRTKNLTAIDGMLLDCKKDNNFQSVIVDDVECYRIAYANAPKNVKKKNGWQRLFSK